MRTTHWFSALLAGLSTMALVTAPRAGVDSSDGPSAEVTASEAFGSQTAIDVLIAPLDADEDAPRALPETADEDEASTTSPSLDEPISPGTLTRQSFATFPALLVNHDSPRRATEATGRGFESSTARQSSNLASSGAVTAATPGQSTGVVSTATDQSTSVVTTVAPAPPTGVGSAVAPDSSSFAISVAPELSAGPGLAVLRREILADALFNLYSPRTGTRTASGREQIWLGGWDKLESLPWDRIFLGHLDEAKLLPTLTTAVAVAGAAVNDPTVTTVPGSSDLRMYFTLLASEHFDESTRRNVVWTGRSTDNGATWHDFQEAIGQANGVNSCGAWSPSAVVENSEICVYFHGNSPCLGVYRSCFLPDGLTMAQPTEQLSLPFGLVNVDVFRADDRYLLVGDTLGLASFTEIRALESVDGQTWQPLHNTDDGLLVRAGNGVVFTPHIASVSGNVVTVLFSTRASFDVSDGPNALHRWTIDTRPSH
jgi:hypothetical protein